MRSYYIHYNTHFTNEENDTLVKWLTPLINWWSGKGEDSLFQLSLPSSRKEQSQQRWVLQHISSWKSVWTEMSRDGSAPHVGQFFILTRVCYSGVSDKKIKWIGNASQKHLLDYICSLKSCLSKTKETNTGGRRNALNCEFSSQNDHPKLALLQTASASGCTILF